MRSRNPVPPNKPTQRSRMANFNNYVEELDKDRTDEIITSDKPKTSNKLKRHRKTTLQKKARDPEYAFKNETPEERALIPAKVHVPTLPVGKMTKLDKQDVITTGVEALMRKGFKNPSRILALLGGKQSGLDARTIKACISRVYRRWEITMSEHNQTRVRAEQLQKLGVIEQEVWAMLDGNTTNQERMNLLKMQQEVIKNQAMLAGVKLTGDVNVNISQTNVTNNGFGGKVQEEIEQKKLQQNMAQEFLAILAEKKKNRNKEEQEDIVEGEFKEIDE